MDEETVKTSLMKHLKKLGAEEIVDEISCGGTSRLCDIVYIDNKRKFVCIEVKLTDWKKVIQQALLHTGYADYLYIAMPVPKTQTKKKKIEIECEEKGLGLYWLKEDCDVWILQHSAKESRFREIEYFKKNLEQSIYYRLHITFLAKCIVYQDGRKKKKQEVFCNIRPITKAILSREV